MTGGAIAGLGSRVRPTSLLPPGPFGNNPVFGLRDVKLRTLRVQIARIAALNDRATAFFNDVQSILKS